MTHLDELSTGSSAMIHGIAMVDHDLTLHQRLLALGFRAGKHIKVMRRASFNGPIHVRIGSTDIMLRSSEAQYIQTNPLP